MEVTKIESSDVWKLVFGVPITLALIVLASIFLGHVITTRSDRPTNVTVAAAAPKIDVLTPVALPPHITVSPSQQKIDVNVAAQNPPVVNVSTPPAVVTVLDRRSDAKLPEVLPAPVPIAPKVVPAAIPVSTSPPASSADFKDADLTTDTLYQYADKYIASYCKKVGNDPALAATAWMKKWQQGLNQAVADGIDSDEQSYINRIAIQKRDCFDIEKATPEKIVEGCRIMLRYRDGKLAWLKALKDAATNENLKKTLVFLAAGVR